MSRAHLARQVLAEAEHVVADRPAGLVDASQLRVPGSNGLPRYSVPPPLPPIAALVLIVVVAIVIPVPFLPQAVSLALGIPLALLSVGLWAWGMSSFIGQGESASGPAH